MMSMMGCISSSAFGGGFRRGHAGNRAFFCTTTLGRATKLFTSSTVYLFPIVGCSVRTLSLFSTHTVSSHLPLGAMLLVVWVQPTLLFFLSMCYFYGVAVAGCARHGSDWHTQKTNRFQAHEYRGTHEVAVMCWSGCVDFLCLRGWVDQDRVGCCKDIHGVNGQSATRFHWIAELEYHQTYKVPVPWT